MDACEFVVGLLKSVLSFIKPVINPSVQIMLQVTVSNWAVDFISFQSCNFQQPSNLPIFILIQAIYMLLWGPHSTQIYLACTKLIQLR